VWGDRIPKWGTIPAGAVVFALLLYLLSSQVLFDRFLNRNGVETGPMSVAVYLEEHELSYSQQILSPAFLADITTVQTTETTEDVGTDEPVSELDMLVEVHYGFYPTDGT
jgi:hypothetical protein